MYTPAEVYALATEAGLKAEKAYDAEGNGWYPCGFSRIQLKGRSKLVTYLKSQGLGGKGYPKGYSVGAVGAHSQSMCRTEAICNAMASVFNEHGFEAYVRSNID